MSHRAPQHQMQQSQHFLQDIQLLQLSLFLVSDVLACCYRTTAVGVSRTGCLTLSPVTKGG